MKVVIYHDWLTGFRGGERALELFCEIFPDAPLYTLIYKKNSTSEIIENRKIHTSFLDNIPGIYSQYRKFLPLFPLAVEMMDVVEDADLIFSTSHCVIKGLKKPSKAKHICYIHSPMRYLYDQYDNYFGADAPFYQRMGMKLFRAPLTNWDLRSNENVDHFLSNSQFVADRVKKYYGREAEVAFGFVDLKDFPKERLEKEKEDFYLMVSAFAPNKRVDLAVETFNKLGLPLKIIGSGQMEKSLKAMAGSNVEFLGNCSREEVVDHFFRAKAFIFPGVEDFGITPLESMASGTPIIAFRAGGVLETLNDNVAQFFDEPTVKSLTDAIEKFRQRKFDKMVLRKRAEEFSRAVFKERIESAVARIMNS